MSANTITPAKPQIFFITTIVLGVAVWMLFLITLSLPRNSNRLTSIKLGSYFNHFVFEDQLAIYQQPNLYVIDFKTQQTQVIPVSDSLESLHWALYWKDKKRLYLTGKGQVIQVIDCSNPQELRLHRTEKNPYNLSSLIGWQIDTLNQQLITFEVTASLRELRVNLRNEDGIPTQPTQSMKVWHHPRDYVHVNKMVKVDTNYYFSGHISMKQTGIFLLKSLPNEQNYRYRLEFTQPVAYSTTYGNLWRKTFTDTLLTTKGMQVTAKPSFLPKKQISRHTITYLKNGYTQRKFTYWHQKLNQNYSLFTSYTPMAGKVLKCDDHRYDTQVNLLDSTGKLLAKNTIPHLNTSLLLNPIILGNEIVVLDTSHDSQLRYVRLNTRTLQRIGTPVTTDLPEKIRWVFKSEAQKLYYLIVALALLGFPLAMWLRQANGWKAYTVLALLAIGFQGFFLSYYF